MKLLQEASTISLNPPWAREIKPSRWVGFLMMVTTSATEPYSHNSPDGPAKSEFSLANVSIEQGSLTQGTEIDQHQLGKWVS
jgi:hypothetical protein